MKRIRLLYGTEGVDLVTDTSNVTVLEPRFIDGVPDEPAGFRSAVRQPIGGKPLRETVGANDRVAIVIPDITRALPTERLLTWLFAELVHVPARNFTIVNGTGSHRASTHAELEKMVGKEIARSCRGEQEVQAGSGGGGRMHPKGPYRLLPRGCNRPSWMKSAV